MSASGTRDSWPIRAATPRPSSSRCCPSWRPRSSTTATLIADAKSGVSGAGRKAEIDLLYSESSDNFKAYAVKGHRHHPEILESLACLESVSGRHLGLTFVPHLVPMVRGILATVYARITANTDFQALFESRYAKEPFVDVLPPGSQPETRWVRGTNQCRIAVHRPFDGDTLVVLAVEDNLVKGAAGQAVQNMNLMFGFPETAGAGTDRRGAVMRSLGRRLRSNFGIGSSRMTIRSQLAWYWRWLLNVLMMVAVAAVVWWLVQNSYRITGFERRRGSPADHRAHGREPRAQDASWKRSRAPWRSANASSRSRRRRRASWPGTWPSCRTRTRRIKEDLGFLRRLMSSGATPEGIGIADLKVERGRRDNEYRYRMLLTQGGQRKQDFKGKVQIVAHIDQGTTAKTIVFPGPGLAGGLGRIRIPLLPQGRRALHDPRGRRAQERGRARSCASGRTG